MSVKSNQAITWFRFYCSFEIGLAVQLFVQLVVPGLILVLPHSIENHSKGQNDLLGLFFVNGEGGVLDYSAPSSFFQ